MKLDDIDWDILEVLQENGRTGFRELGRRIGLSAPAVAARVRKLESEGIISGYRAIVDPEALGLRVLAFVRLTLASADPSADDEVTATAREIPEVRALYRVTGSETYLLEVVVRVVHDLERVLRPFWRFGATTTGAVMSTPVFHPVVTRAMIEVGDA